MLPIPCRLTHLRVLTDGRGSDLRIEAHRIVQPGGLSLKWVKTLRFDRD
ncbi:hypothetical protein HNQ72_002188 [Rhizobium wenxiniae]|uniref:Uncharacterized protein n=1 Tax=Rhizobium wenxiniae TaxID=1737357 RepID=A0A7X0CZH9_9HYPH|nr:hypothetical protein [Rhizobium wenxiniae]